MAEKASRHYRSYHNPNGPVISTVSLCIHAIDAGT